MLSAAREVTVNPHAFTTPGVVAVTVAVVELFHESSTISSTDIVLRAWLVDTADKVVEGFMKVHVSR